MSPLAVGPTIWRQHSSGLEPRKITEHPFEGTITRIDTAPIQISCVKATKHRVLRLRSHITRSTDDLCFVNLQLEGVGRYTQRGHEQTCGPGDLAVADTTEPFEIANCRDFRLFCFAVPRHLLPPGFSERPRLSLSATEAGRALSRTLRSYAELCLNAPQASGISAFSGASIVELISHAPQVLAAGPSERINAPVLLSMMLDHIDRHSERSRSRCRPARGKVQLLATLRAQAVFRHGSNGRRTHQRQTDCCLHPQFLGSDHRTKTIAEIAFAAGFRDISYFNRLFKRSNGVAPREFRRSMSSTAA